MPIDHSEIKKEMSELQEQLKKGLENMLLEIGNRLKPDEKESIKKEVAEINELIERLKTGLIWIALFGKTCAGKSALANALINADKAKVGIEHDLTGTVTYYVKEPYNIGDVPGIMGKRVNKVIALDEAQKAHGHIFIVDTEPFEEETELFDYVMQQTPNASRIVFVNKMDLLEHMTSSNAEKVKGLIYKKMRKYVTCDEDIVYGSAELKINDEMVRQPQPKLEERLYSDTSTLGAIINVYDPAERAIKLSSEVKAKIVEVRQKVARKIINVYALAQVGSTVVPFGDLVIAPGLLVSMTRSLVAIMGEKETGSFDKSRTAIDILKVCGQFLAVEFIGITIMDTIADFLGFGFGGVVLDLMGVSIFKYRRTLIFGEAVLLYIENGFSFGYDAREMIIKAKESAKRNYEKFKVNRN